MSGVHATAIIAPGAEIGSNVEIGPYCVIGPHVKIGDGACLRPHVVIDGHTTIGAGCNIFSFACIGSQTQDLKYRGGSSTVDIGERTTLREYVTVNSGTHEGERTVVGAGCHIMAYCHVAHACRVGDGVIMANGATLAGDVRVDDQAVIGGLSGVHQFCRIGRLCMVGGCTKVVKDCPPYMMVDGNPAEVRGLNLIGLERRGVSEDDRNLLKKAYRLLYRKDLPVSQALDEIRNTLGTNEALSHLVDFVATSERGILK
ncbi:MAG TPA: acyl-[acyl-carrier-protein]--UDP-N-acetylglucosamine O-acyltransferase [Verrucomicrobia bacterium]|nr:acyl-[acyl-carrier-protein]--UDP-N-acetylglucosamine O-acyltransferase [Verrucomicrobiota bacterium]